MLLLLPIMIALTSDPMPAQSGPPRATPLTVIGRVHALPACVPIVAHANSVIADVLENDRLLSMISRNLRSTDYDRLDVLQRRSVIDSMLRQAETVGKASTAGDGEIKRLREYATNSADPGRKAELKIFTDAIGGAMYRQKKAAVEFARDVAILRAREDTQDIRDRVGDDGIGTTRAIPRAGTTAATPIRPMTPPEPQYDRHLKLIAETFDELNQGIMRDEGIAADHSIAATSGC